jgi:hypothetical protein
VNLGYQMKDMRSSGTSALNFNHRSLVERHSTIAFNIGDLYQRHGRDQTYFRTVNLDDPAFRQREIAVGIDGALVKEFERYINAVTVTLRKQHQNGEETLREVVLDRQAVARQSTGLRLVYGWNGDQDQAAWLQYDVRTRWSFMGGGSYQTEWTRGDRAMIDLFAPYERRVVQIVGDRAALLKQRVRAVIVQVEYPFFGEQRRQQAVLRPDQPGEDPRVEITLPLGQFEYDYVITWQLEGNRRLTSRGRDGAAVLFVDELPPGQ